MTNPGDSGHMAGPNGHNTLRVRVLAQAARFKAPVNPGGPWALGDPGHIQVHNAMTAALAGIGQYAGVTLALPNEAFLGDTGHTTDHDLWAAALATLEATPMIPTLAHTGYGQFTIGNYDSTATYTVTVSAGTFTQTGPVINTTAVDCVVGVTMRTTTLTATRRPYTFHDEQRVHDVNGSNLHFDGGVWHWDCPPGYASDGGQYGVNVCRGSVTVSVKDATPSGFVDAHGEWVKLA